MLKDIFITLLSKYSNDTRYIDSLWKSIEKQHTQKSRYYHNLTHLKHLYNNLKQVQDQIQDWDIVLFALFYHDYIYNTLQKDNEEKSAKKVIKILNTLSSTQSRTTLCSSIILATKGHSVSKNPDINYFTDADLSILGSDWKSYQTYFKSIRKEYKFYPDFMYTKGRIKVLQHFLEMPQIFKTDYFYNQLESQAKSNLIEEIKLLSK